MMSRDAARAAAFEQKIGARLRARRRQLGLSQSELASKLGVSFQQVQKYERGANRVAASTLAAAAAALGVSIGWLAAEEAPQDGERDLLSALSRPAALETAGLQRHSGRPRAQRPAGGRRRAGASQPRFQRPRLTSC